jgi:hypothetical protein
MALGTGMTAVAFDMVRLCSGCKFVLMAAIAVSRCVCESRGMTGQAGHARVCAGQRETRTIVIKQSFAPTTSIVALRTIMREVVCHMIRVFGPHELVLMTTIAISRRASESGGMAGDATGTCMRTRQGEYGLAMVKCGRLPGRGAMALSAVMVEVVRRVIRVLGRDELVLMAAVARCGCVHESSAMT